MKVIIQAQAIEKLNKGDVVEIVIDDEGITYARAARWTQDETDQAHREGERLSKSIKWR
jgi:TusA-related sulfurtransferase